MQLENFHFTVLQRYKMAQCLYPYMLDNETPVGCGKCLHCKNKRVSGWAFRLQKEDMRSCMSFFITLTYDTDNVPITPRGRMTLQPSHLTTFWKIHRKRLKAKGLKYYACGEYGSNKQRPHYHAIVFIYDAKITATQYINALEQDWKYGSTYVGSVTAESVAYTLKYISKPTRIPMYHGDDRIKEFQRSSKGLGSEYINDTMKSWHLNDLEKRCYLPLKGGNKAAMPRYYKDKIYTIEQRAEIARYMEQNNEQRNYEQLELAREAASIKLNR